MFRKPKRSNIRQRRQDQDSDDDQETQSKGEKSVTNEVVDLEEKRVPVSVPAAVVPTAGPVTAKLSFAQDHEDEGTEFKVRKSSHSRRVAKQLEKERRKRLEEMSQKEREAKKLTEEKQSLNYSISIRKQMENKELDVVFVNQHTVKRQEEPEQKPADEVIQVPDEDGMSDDSGDETPAIPTFRPAAARSSIPDAETIFSLKKQRQRRRNQEDFIALTQETMPADGPEGEKPDEDDEEFEDDRIDFQVDKSQAERMKAREAISSAQEEESLNKSSKSGRKRETGSPSSSSSASSDNELSKWEEEQILKGVGSTSSKKVAQRMDQHNSELMDVSSPQGVNPVSLFERKSTPGSTIPSHLTRSRTHVSIDDVISRLQDSVTEKQDKLNYLDRQLADMGMEEKTLNEQLERLESQQKELETRRTELVQRLQQQLTDKDTSEQ